ncbi:hypothetical protein ACFL1P_00490 [Patescibacteria group bacterium]
MPKKTKKQKRSADKRRHTSNQVSRTSDVVDTKPQNSNKGNNIQFTFQANDNPRSSNTSIKNDNTTQLIAIKKDLRKTLILAVIGISIEVLLAYYL